MSHKPKQPSTAVLRKLSSYHYDVVIGKIYNAKGAEVGRLYNTGYYCIQVLDGDRWQNLKRSHIIWWARHGVWPVEQLDHRDRNKQNDSIDNLRYINDRGNVLNAERCLNRELPTGVYFHEPSKSKPFQARANGKPVGYYATPEEAHQAYLQHVRG